MKKMELIKIYYVVFFLLLIVGKNVYTNAKNSSTYTIGLYRKIDYQAFERNKDSIKLDPEDNYNELIYDNANLKLIYQRSKEIFEEYCISNITNLKFIWDLSESKKSLILNEFCFLFFDRKLKNGFLFCAINTEAKVLTLNLIYEGILKSSTKIKIVNEKNSLSQNEHKLDNKENKNTIKAIFNDEVYDNSLSHHYIYFQKYTIYSGNALILKRNENSNIIKTEKFKNVKIKIADSMINFKIYSNENILENFLQTNNLTPKIGKSINLNFYDLLCNELDQENEILYLTSERVQKKLISEIFLKSPPKELFNGFCWSISPCNEDFQYLLCFKNEISYLKFRRVFTIVGILFQFMDRWEHIWDKVNTKVAIKNDLGNFISQNMQKSPGEFIKSKEELQNNPDFNRIYKTYRYFFKKPISNDIIFLKDSKYKTNDKIIKMAGLIN